MHVATADTQGNPNIGLYAYATDEYCILGPEAEMLKPLIEEALQVPVIITTIAGTSMAGVFLAGTNDVLLAPTILFEHEQEVLEKAGITVKLIETNHTALGNLIVANKHGSLISQVFSEDEEAAIAEALGVTVHPFAINEVEVIGSSFVVNSRGGLIHRDASNFEQDMAKDVLRLSHITPGTVNFGVPYVRGGVIANSKGFLIGSTSGGPEIQNADEALGFLDEE